MYCLPIAAWSTHGMQVLPLPAVDRMHSRKVVLLSAATRVIQASLLETYFNPDEYWQSLEVAHLLAFGCGAGLWRAAAVDAESSVNVHPTAASCMQVRTQDLGVGCRSSRLLASFFICFAIQGT